MAGDALLVIFARAPEPARVKTRLIPRVGPGGAAALQAAFLDDVCRLSRGAAGRRLLSVDGDRAHPALVELARREGIALVAQGEGDLGARLGRTFADAFAGGAERVAVIGSDSPALPPEMLRRAVAALASANVVLGPADDGGYWMIGLARSLAVAPSRLLEGIPWGTASVLAATERRLAALGLEHRRAERFWDVDEPADLDRLRAALDGDLALAPATRRALAVLGDCA